MDNLYSVLLVDDEPTILNGMTDTYDWKTPGFYVCGTAESGESALEKIKENSPDVIMADIRMHNMDGLELIRQAQKISDQMEYVVISAYRDFNYAQTACSLGVFSYLLKPFSDSEFLSVMNPLKEYLDRKSVERQILRLYDLYRDDILIIKKHNERIRDDDGTTGDYLRKAMLYIEKHIDDPGISVVTAAEALHLNATYFGRIFKQGVGKSFRETLQFHRIEKATLLLMTTKMTVTEVAYAVGVDNLPYFSSQFKKLTGILPSEIKGGQSLEAYEE
ncbi:MAG: response regulator [Oscillospiraceae bacterium]|nr:response regulator [Oscillospiraceae bacterium]